MVWGAFSANGQTELALMTGRQNTKSYLKIMEDVLLPYSDDNMPIDRIYQQDNATIHVSRAAKQWFTSNGVCLMNWPPRSPDLSPIENVWGWWAKRVCMNNRQFSPVRDLTNCVFNEWKELPHSLLKTLLDSMKKRCIEVLQRSGGVTHY